MAATARFAVPIFLLALLTPAAAQAAGVNLSWTACGAAGQASRSFSCDTNAGTAHVLVGSLVAPAGVTIFEGFTAVLTVQSESATLSPWWQLRPFTAGCRTGALTVSADFRRYTPTCSDFFYGRAVAGLGVFEFETPNRVRLTVSAQGGPTIQGPLNAGDEYYMFALTITNAKTVGVGACSGCASGACIVFRSIIGNGVNVSGPATRDYVTWNNPSSSTCAGTTPARASTWGQIKSQYH